MEEIQGSTNKDQEKLKNKHTEIMQLLKLKILYKGINSRISEAEERISEMEDKMVEITSEENKVKRKKRSEDSLRDLWENIKHTQTFELKGSQKKKKR